MVAENDRSDQGGNVNHSETIAKVAGAVTRAQAALQNVTCDAENPHFKNNYVSLPALLDAVRPVLAEHKLALVQLPANDGDRIGIETILMHESGEWIGASLFVRPIKDDPQQAGSAITYCRRYSLAAALAIGQEDDDGNAASGKAKREREPARQSAREQAPQSVPPRAAEGDPISEAQRKRLFAIYRKASSENGWPDTEADAAVKAMLADRGISSSREIPRNQYDAVIEAAQALFAPVDPNHD